MPPLRAHAEMLIQAKVADVFSSLVKPRELVRFWLDRASGPLRKGARVEWEFMVPGARDTVTVTKFAKNRRLAFDWSDGTQVDLRFHPQGRGKTHVEVTASGFKGKDAVPNAIETTEGFAIVLCDLKTLLETGESGQMVRDKAALISDRMKAARRKRR